MEAGIYDCSAQRPDRIERLAEAAVAKYGMDIDRKLLMVNVLNDVFGNAFVDDEAEENLGICIAMTYDLKPDNIEYEINKGMTDEEELEEDTFSTYCGTMTHEEAEKHVKECGVCREDFIKRGLFTEEDLKQE